MEDKTRALERDDGDAAPAARRSRGRGRPRKHHQEPLIMPIPDYLACTCGEDECDVYSKAGWTVKNSFYDCKNASQEGNAKSRGRSTSGRLENNEGGVETTRPCEATANDSEVLDDAEDVPKSAADRSKLSNSSSHGSLQDLPQCLHDPPYDDLPDTDDEKMWPVYPQAAEPEMPRPREATAPPTPIAPRQQWINFLVCVPQTATTDAPHYRPSEDRAGASHEEIPPAPEEQRQFCKGDDVQAIMDVPTHTKNKKMLHKVLVKGTITKVNSIESDGSQILLQWKDPADNQDLKKWVRKEDYDKLRPLPKEDAKKVKAKQVKGKA